MLYLVMNQLVWPSKLVMLIVNLLNDVQVELGAGKQRSLWL